MRFQAGRNFFGSRLLAPPDIGSLQSLFERAADYFELVTGRGPGPDEAERAFVAGPPTKSVNDKRTLGVFEGDRLVGVLDAIVDWPDEGVWSVGIFLLDPEVRGTGLGSAVLAAFECWAADRGARTFRTAVPGDHAAGRAYLRKAGYVTEEILDGYAAGSRTTNIVFYTKTVLRDAAHAGSEGADT